MEDFVRAHGKERIDARVDDAAQYTYGMPFSWYPLGEGPTGEFDRRPLFRFDTFDCSTWVDTVIALSESQSFPDFIKRINSIRYSNGIVSFQTRNHFPNTDWIENNVHSGLLTDVTEHVAGDISLSSKTVYNTRAAWYAKLDRNRIFLPSLTQAEQQEKLGELRKLDQSTEQIASTVNYIPLDSIIVPFKDRGRFKSSDLKPLVLSKPHRPHLPGPPEDYLVNEALLDRIPTPSLIQIIKVGWDRRGDTGLIMDVGHRGILSRRNGKLYFQQMSLLFKRSLEIPLAEDLFYRLEDPPVKGVNFYLINDLTHPESKK